MYNEGEFLLSVGGKVISQAKFKKKKKKGWKFLQDQSRVYKMWDLINT